MATSLYTLDSLDQAVLARLENNSTFWPTAERYRVINEAIRCTNLLTGFYQGTLTLYSVAGQLVYPTPAGMLYPQRVQFEGVQLDPIPATRIGQDYRTWAQDNSIRNGPVARWVPIGINYFCLHPADSYGGGSIAVTGVISTPLLVLPTDSITLEDQFVTIIVEYSAHRLPLKVGGSNFAQASKLYSAGFQPAIKSRTNLAKFKFPKYWVNTGSPTTEGKIQ